jgi:hypothetical protein
MSRINEERVKANLHIKPLVNGSYIEEVDSISKSYIWDPKKTTVAKDLVPFQVIAAKSYFGHHGFFKPSVGEVIDCIPDVWLNETAAFEIIGNIVTNDDHHAFNVQLYKDAELSKNDWQKRLIHYYLQNKLVIKAALNGRYEVQDDFKNLDLIFSMTTGMTGVPFRIICSSILEAAVENMGMPNLCKILLNYTVEDGVIGSYRATLDSHIYLKPALHAILSEMRFRRRIFSKMELEEIEQQNKEINRFKEDDYPYETTPMIEEWLKERQIDSARRSSSDKSLV